MKRATLPVAALAACGSLTSCSVFGGANAVNLHGGGRDLQKAADGVSDQSVYGAEVVLGLPGTDWALEAQGFRAEGDGPGSGGFESDVETTEFAVGGRYTFLTSSPVRPYFGLGANWMDAELSNPSYPTISDDGFGGYAHAGVLAAILSFQVGLDVRGGLSGAKLAGERQDYVQATLFLGLTW